MRARRRCQASVRKGQTLARESSKSSTARAARARGLGPDANRRAVAVTEALHERLGRGAAVADEDEEAAVAEELEEELEVRDARHLRHDPLSVPGRRGHERGQPLAEAAQEQSALPG